MEDIEEKCLLKSGDENGGDGGKGRMLYCRKCEGHGEQIILKGHAPICPYILCQCLSCEKLMNKRLKSFNKRNREKIQLATTRKISETNRRIELFDGGDSGRGSSSTPSSGTCTPDTVMSVCSSQQPSSSKSSSTGLEGRSMSMGTMTVMSYDIWKAKCAAERKEKEEKDKERKASLPARTATPEMMPRKRAHTFVSVKDAQLPRIRLNGQKDEKKGRYITLPTIPPLSVLIPDDEATDFTPNEVQAKKSRDEIKSKIDTPTVLPAPVPRKIGTNLPPPTFFINPSSTPITTVSQSTPIQSTPVSQVPFSCPISYPSPLPTPKLSTDQFLASMFAQTPLPTSFYQNSFLNTMPPIQSPPQPQPNLFSLLGGDLSTLLSTLSQPATTIPQANPFLEVLQRSIQLQQLTASLSALSPPGGSPIDTASLNQLINRQPLFSSTI